MVIFKKENTESTPAVDFDYSSKVLSIKGVCSPENPIAFFEEIFTHINEFKQQNSELLVEFTFDYFNTGSSKCILNLLFKIKSKTGKDFNCKINWFVLGDDEEMRESGELFEELSGLKFNYLTAN